MGATFMYDVIPAFAITKTRMNTIIKIAMDLSVNDLAQSTRFNDHHNNNPIPYKIELVAALETLPHIHQLRTVSNICLGLNSFLITGGMSHGDSPTNAYDTFGIINDCPKIYKQLLRWSLDDWKPLKKPAHKRRPR